MKANKTISLFDIISDVISFKKRDLDKHPDFNKMMSSFMLVRYLSMRNELMPYVEILNRIQTGLTKEQFYHLACDLIPKSRNGFVKYYLKKEKAVKNEISDDVDSEAI